MNISHHELYIYEPNEEIQYYFMDAAASQSQDTVFFWDRVIIYLLCISSGRVELLI